MDDYGYDPTEALAHRPGCRYENVGGSQTPRWICVAPHRSCRTAGWVIFALLVVVPLIIGLLQGNA